MQGHKTSALIWLIRVAAGAKLELPFVHRAKATHPIDASYHVRGHDTAFMLGKIFSQKA